MTMPNGTSNPADGGKPGEGTAGTDGAGTKPETPVTFEMWFATAPDEAKGYIEDHTHGLKTALEAERTQRKALDKQLKDLAKKYEKGSDERVELDKMSAQLAAGQRQTDFYDAAHKAGVTNLKLAWLAAQSDELIDDKGVVDFAKLKEAHPQLFTVITKTPPPPGNAGEGRGGQQAAGSMSDFIRRQAGRGQ